MSRLRAAGAANAHSRNGKRRWLQYDLFVSLRDCSSMKMMYVCVTRWMTSGRCRKWRFAKYNKHFHIIFVDLGEACPQKILPSLIISETFPTHFSPLGTEQVLLVEVLVVQVPMMYSRAPPWCADDLARGLVVFILVLLTRNDRRHLDNK